MGRAQRRNYLAALTAITLIDAGRKTGDPGG